APVTRAIAAGLRDRLSLCTGCDMGHHYACRTTIQHRQDTAVAWIAHPDDAGNVGGTSSQDHYFQLRNTERGVLLVEYGEVKAEAAQYLCSMHCWYLDEGAQQVLALLQPLPQLSP